MISFHRGFADVGQRGANCATLLTVILIPDGLLELSETGELQSVTYRCRRPIYMAHIMV